MNNNDYASLWGYVQDFKVDEWIEFSLKQDITGNIYGPFFAKVTEKSIPIGMGGEGKSIVNCPPEYSVVSIRKSKQAEHAPKGYKTEDCPTIFNVSDLVSLSNKRNKEAIDAYFDAKRQGEVENQLAILQKLLNEIMQQNANLLSIIIDKMEKPND